MSTADAGGVEWEGRVRLQPTGPGPAVVDVSALSAGSFALLDEQGRRVAFAVTCEEDDPARQELSFVAGKDAGYMLHYARRVGASQWPVEGLSVEEVMAGSWEPIRLAPVNARVAGVSLEAARQRNAAGAARVAQGLRAEGPMLVVRTAAWEVWIGGHSGLIERLRPVGHQWAGSVLREWAANLPNVPASGNTVVTRNTATRVRLRHYGDVLRDLEIWADGTLLTTTEAKWAEPRLVVAGHPLERMTTAGAEQSVAFDDRVDRGPAAAGGDALGWEQAGGGALSCQVTGGAFDTVEALTQGEDAVALLAADGTSGLGGLCRTVVPAAWWEAHAACLSGGGDVRLDYTPRRLGEMPGGRFGLQQARFGLLEGTAGRPSEPVPAEPLERPVLTISPADPAVTCYLPSRGLGPRLEPTALAINNPPVVWYDVVAELPEGAAEARVVVEAAPWLERVQWRDPGRGIVEAPRAGNRYETVTPVTGAQMRLQVGLKAAEGALGPLQTTVRCLAPDRAALTALRMHVEPCVPLFALGAGAQPGVRATELRVATQNEWVQLAAEEGAGEKGLRMALVSDPGELTEDRVLQADLPLLAPVDLAGAQQLAGAWRGAQEALGAAGAASKQLLAACLLPGDGPQADYADMVALSWACWGLGIADGGMGWHSALPLGWETDEGILPTDRLLAVVRTARDLRLLGLARAQGKPTAAAVELVRQGEFAAGRALLGD